MIKVIKVIGCFLLFLVCLNIQAQQKKYLPLPDGSSLEVKEGMTAQQAWQQAMRVYPEAFGLKRIDENLVMDVDWFNQCRTRVAREAKTDASLNQMVQACRYQAVPKKCRIFSIKTDKLGNEVADELMTCYQACKESNIYSRTAGECSKG
jgi:hypothetical protein